jgi:hypothetical protein
MSSTRGHFEGLSEKPDHRVYPRSNLPWLTYVELGNENGGIAMNISEGGLAVTAAGIVLSDYFPRMRFQLGKSADWIEASGQVVWTSDSRKGIGIRFDELPEVDREKIRDWISAKDPADDGPERATGRGPEVKPFSQTRGGIQHHKLTRKLEVLSEEDEARFASMFPSESSLQWPGARDSAKPETERAVPAQMMQDLTEFSETRGDSETFNTAPTVESNIEDSHPASHVEATHPLLDSHDTDSESFQDISIPETNSPTDTPAINRFEAEEETAGEAGLNDFEGADSLLDRNIVPAEDEAVQEPYFHEEDLPQAAGARESLEAEEKSSGEWALPSITYLQDSDWRQQFNWNRGRDVVEPSPQQAVAIAPKSNRAALIAVLGILTAAICFLVGLIVGNGSLSKLLKHDSGAAVSSAPAAAPAETDPGKSPDAAESAQRQSPQVASSYFPDASSSNSSGALDRAAVTAKSGTDAAASTPSSGVPASREPYGGETPPASDMRQEARAGDSHSGDTLSNNLRSEPSSGTETSASRSPAAVFRAEESGPQTQMDTNATSAAASETAQSEKPFSEVQGPILVTPPDEKSGPFRLMLAEQAISASRTLAISAQRSILVPALSGPASTHRPERLQAGVLIYHVDPIVPAAGDDMGGTVKVRATIGKGGDVVDVKAISGPGSLLPGVMRAVREWRYTVTLLDGQPLGAEEVVVVEFRPKS